MRLKMYYIRHFAVTRQAQAVLLVCVLHLGAGVYVVKVTLPMFNKLLSIFQRKSPVEGGVDDRPDVPKKMVFLVRTDVGMQKGKMCA